MKEIIFWLNIIFSLIVIGEASALIIGMNISSQEGYNWLTLKNYVIIILDIVLGIIIFFLILNNKGINNYLYIIFFLIIIVVTHLYRDFEFFYDINDKFCFNMPLFLVNNLKLILSIGCISLVTYIQLNY
ncbi:MAG: hypothetical protein KGD63_12120 [Candidatus Lokiarchaeota archaeon]|nr:hypothetical protein [Candidatus Lokiarchaeota archaeon]